MSSGRSQKERYQPGGTALLTQGDKLGRVVKRGSDEIGGYM